MSDLITTANVTELGDQKLKQVAKRVYYTARLAAEKAVAHFAEPTKYPIAADPNSDEQIFLTRFKGLQPALQQAAVIRIMSSVKAAQQQRAAMYGDLAQVNLGLATTVGSQVRAMPFPAALKFPISHLNNLKLHGDILRNIPIIPTIPSIPGSGLTPQQTLNKLEFRLHRVWCADETNPEWGGDDDISLAGTMVDETGDTHKVGPFAVGGFDDGDVRNYTPPMRFTSFDLLEGGTAARSWPKSYFVTLVLAEVDMGGLADFVDYLLRKVGEKVQAALAAAVGAAVGSLGGPIGSAVGAAIGWVLGEIFKWIRAWIGDDVFAPITTSIRIPSLTARWAGGKTDSPEGAPVFVGHGGTYQLTYDWRLFA